jgi:7,8-dihydropterin-6-yl-methyl-4-(beta-D-ribofuranosyl)aminobenzene 5'-phosphate synthase
MRRFLTWGLVLLVSLIVVGLVSLEVRQRRGTREAAERFASNRPPPMGDFGTTNTLSILPLVDWHTARPQLRGELGLSYLVETDHHRILFDVAHNARSESPSPLEHNMRALGVAMDDVDTVFISHNHLDHVGGMRRQMERTFGIGLEQAELQHPGARAFVPIPMSYPGLEPIHADAPMQLGQGVATTGTVGRQLVLGWIDEQSLAVNVEGLGVVLIVGCGHQPIPSLLRRYDQVFHEPLYGIIGGLHLPVPEGRMKLLGLDGQRRLASGGGLFSPLTMADVEGQLSLLRGRNLGVIGVGGHDSSDEVIAMFAEAFGEAYRYVRVGEPIVIAP